jgi:hypothetical protein
MRSDRRLPIVSRAAGSSRDDWALGSTSDGVSWKVSTPNVCSTTRPTSDDSDPVMARVARSRRSCCCGVMLVLYWTNSTSCPGATSPKSRLSTSTSASGGSASNDGVRRSSVPAARAITR